MFVKDPNVPCVQTGSNMQSYSHDKAPTLYSGDLIEFQNYYHNFVWVPSYFYSESSTICTFKWTLLIMPKIRGVKNIFGGVNILFRGVTTDIWGSSTPYTPPENLSMLRLLFRYSLSNDE